MAQTGGTAVQPAEMTLPCRWCARPVPQTPGAGRKRMYCPDRD